MHVDAKDSDWDNVRFARRHKQHVDARSSRFATAVIVFLLVALVYPWYSYWVSAFLLKREMQIAAIEFDRAANMVIAESNHALAVSLDAARADALRSRVASVQVMGVVAGNPSTAIVQFGASNVDEAQYEICRQALAWLGKPMPGKVLRVQRHRGNQPALDVRTIACR